MIAVVTNTPEVYTLRQSFDEFLELLKQLDDNSREHLFVVGERAEVGGAVMIRLGTIVAVEDLGDE